MTHRDRFGLVGNTIAGTFRVDEVVAEGGFGIIYRAYHLHFRSKVALKCLKIPVELTEDERQTFLEQFRSEAEILFRLSASLPNIVRPLHVDAVRTGAGLFVPLMALEWLEGETFEKIIERRTFQGLPPLALSEVMDLLTPTAIALHEAHNFQVQDGVLSVIHRDVKPDNLMLTNVNGQPVVKLLDFGISKVRRTASEFAGHLSQTGGQAPFSPAYGAPEQWLPKRYGATGPWTDVWGLALTLCEIIKGDAVIVGDHQAMMGTALDLKKRPSPRGEGVNVTDEIEGVFLKALSVDPRYRYQSVRAFWEALQAAIVIGGDPTLEPVETPSGRITLPPMSAPTPWEPLSVGEKPRSSAKIAGLPPMLAPAPLERTEGDSPIPDEFGDSYPIDPSSSLAPVPAAPALASEFDLHIPPMADYESSAEHEPLYDSGVLEAAPAARIDAPIELELAATSVVPPRSTTDTQLHDTSLHDLTHPRVPAGRMDAPQLPLVDLSDEPPPPSIDLGLEHARSHIPDLVPERTKLAPRRDPRRDADPPAAPTEMVQVARVALGKAPANASAPNAPAAPRAAAAQQPPAKGPPPPPKRSALPSSAEAALPPGSSGVVARPGVPPAPPRRSREPVAPRAALPGGAAPPAPTPAASPGRYQVRPPLPPERVRRYKTGE